MNSLRPIVFVIFLIASVFSLTAFSEPIQDTSPFRAIHLEKGKTPIFYKLSGSTTVNESPGTSQPGHVQSIKDEILANKETSVTLQDVEEWVALTSKPYSFNFDIDFWGYPELYRSITHYPEKTLNPWMTLTELIVNGDNCFTIDHNKKGISLMDQRNFLEHLKKGQSFPLLVYFLYPCNLLHGEESNYALTVRERGDKMVDLVAVNQSPLPAPTDTSLAVFYKEIRAELLLDAGFSAKRCLLKRMNTHRMDTIVLMDFSGHRQTPFGYFPEKVTITRWWQCTNPEFEPESEARTYLLPSNLSWDFNQDFSVRTFSQQWEGTLQDVRCNIDLNDETFWPSVPEGYTYSDQRACYKELEEKMMADRSALTKDEKALLAGIGPHAFAK